MIYTPDMNDGRSFFVFGSNLAGRHGAGAALEAKLHWGAKNGLSYGLMGRSFAIPTKDHELKSLPSDLISRYIGYFIKYARRHPHTRYLVTAIGCGLAGHDPLYIAPYFEHAPDNCVLPPRWRNYWHPTHGLRAA